MFEYYGCPRQSCPFRNRVRCQPGFYYDTENNYNRCVGCQQNYYCPGGLGSGAFQSTCPPGRVPNFQRTGCSIEEKEDPEPDTNTTTDGLEQVDVTKPNFDDNRKQPGKLLPPSFDNNRKQPGKLLPPSFGDKKRLTEMQPDFGDNRPQFKRTINEVANTSDIENYYYC
jgi:hypothetical protein